MKKYQPIPVDTSITPIPEYLQDLTEKLAENVHENWAKKRLEEAWRYGPVRNDAKQETPCLVPYQELPESEREYDRNTALETIRMILKLGYHIVPNNE